MRKMFVLCVIVVSLLISGFAYAEHHEAGEIAKAESAGPVTITADATISTMDGEVLREGSNGWTCYSGNEVIGPMCNQPHWDALLGALMKKAEFTSTEFSVSYMLAGEGDAIGVSNSDPFAEDPTSRDDFVKEGPHLMITVPDPASFEGMSTDPADPVYVMWKGTPYAHIMVRVEEAE